MPDKLDKIARELENPNYINQNHLQKGCLLTCDGYGEGSETIQGTQPQGYPSIEDVVAINADRSMPDAGLQLGDDLPLLNEIVHVQRAEKSHHSLLSTDLGNQSDHEEDHDPVI